MGSGTCFTEEQKSLILGTLLGDGSLEKRWKNARLRIDHAKEQKAYVFWKYRILANVATREPHILYERDKRSGKIFERWYFSTRGMPELDFYQNLFYRNNRKIIREDIGNYFARPLSLAVWLMDDGYKRNDCDALRLSTDCFSYEEQQCLCKCLKNNFGIHAVLHKKNNTWNIYIPSSEMSNVRGQISAYIIPSLAYKLPPRNDLVRQRATR